MWQNLSKRQKVATFVVVASVFNTFALGYGWYGIRQGHGEPVEKARAAAVNAQRSEAQKQGAASLGASKDKQILFGDLHVHTTYSIDAFLISLPVVQGEGSHPPSDACDYARFCSALDFWSINDHAEAITPNFWNETKEAVRQCNAISGDPANPDMVTYLGWEWTQVGTNPQNHYGHKNVILLDTDEDKVPPRPIASAPPKGSALEAVRDGATFWQRVGIGLAGPVAPGSPMAYLSATTFFADVAARQYCDQATDLKDLDNCIDAVATPEDLFTRLAQYGSASQVIPHGTTWGFYTPAASAWDKQLRGGMHSEKYQRLFEIFSGHGNSEEYRPFVATAYDSNGNPSCPEPSASYMPSCWRAGEIIRERCLLAKLDEGECEKRAAKARLNYVKADIPGHLTVQGEEAAEWLNAGQCADCFLPSFNYRPLSSAQYVLAISNFDQPGKPRRFNFGFMASSDNHFARPGTGYKEFARKGNTESQPARATAISAFVPSPDQEPIAKSAALDPIQTKIHRMFFVEAERQASFFMTGGLIAVHSPGRDRQAIWDAMQKKEVYGTSGERILLWFDLDNAAGGKKVMGESAKMRATPRFTVRTLGSFKQKPGCPADSVQSLGTEKLDRLCKGECYNPSNERQIIERIEIVKITPQKYRDEPVKELIKDAWRTFRCPRRASGCKISFTDPSYQVGKRDALYYARVIQQAQPTVNGGHLRCEYDAQGRCTKTRPCNASEPSDDCFDTKSERAWSSPIYLEY